MGPVISPVALTQTCGHIGRDFGRSVQILDCQAHALHLVRRPALHGGGVCDVDQAHGAIQLSADLEDAHHVQALQAWGNAARCGAGLGHDQGDFVAHPQTKAPRSDVAEHHAIFTGFKVFHATLHDVPGHDGHLTFERRIDTTDLDRLHRAFVGQHPFHFGERHRRRHFRVFHRRFSHRPPVINRLYAYDGGVRHHAEDAVTHFTLEAVHHRQHHDHGQNAQGETDHRGHGNKRHKTIAALGAGIARADKNR